MKTTLVNVAVLAMFLVLASCGHKKTDSKDEAKDQNEQKVDSKLEDDSEFAVDAADGGMLEVKLGQLAQTNATASQVKAFGQTMIDDHSKGNNELNQLATQKNITLPETLSAKAQDKFNDLSKKTGKDFDDAYIAFMVKDHKEDIDEFKKEAEKGKDADLKSWAAGKVPVLEHHLEMATQAEKAIGKMK